MTKYIFALSIFLINTSAFAFSPLYTEVSKKCLEMEVVPQAECVLQILANKFPRKGDTLLRQIPDGTEAAEIQTLMRELAREMKPVDDEDLCKDLINTTGTVRAACIDHHKQSIQSLMRIHSVVMDLWTSSKSTKLNKVRLTEYVTSEIKELKKSNPEKVITGDGTPPTPTSK